MTTKPVGARMGKRSGDIIIKKTPKPKEKKATKNILIIGDVLAYLSISAISFWFNVCFSL